MSIEPHCWTSQNWHLALLDDLANSGRLDETLIVMTGEFGRTPAISLVPGAEQVGRNHWAQVYTALFAGGGVQGGRAIGRSDAIGAYPTTRSVTPDDLGTTLCTALGLPSHSELQRRRLRLNQFFIVEAESSSAVRRLENRGFLHIALAHQGLLE